MKRPRNPTTREMPLCQMGGIACDSRGVLNVGATSTERWYYQCCDVVWSQKRPDLLAPGEDPCVVFKGSSDEPYKCKKCRQPKLGHDCPFNSSPRKKKQGTSKTYTCSICNKPKRGHVCIVPELSALDNNAMFNFTDIGVDGSVDIGGDMNVCYICNSSVQTDDVLTVQCSKCSNKVHVLCISVADALLNDFVCSVCESGT